MAGADGVPAERDGPLVDELRVIRQLGFPRVREGRFPHLLQAAAALGHAHDDTPTAEVLRRLVESAIARLGTGREITAISQVFGVAPGTRVWSAADRRAAAARTQGISVERFRRGYEPQMVRLVADEIATMVSGRRSAGPFSGPSAGGAVFADGMHLAGPLAAANARADWRAARGTYRQCVALAEDPSIGDLPEAVLGALSSALEGLAPGYTGAEDEFALHATAVFLDVDQADRITFDRLRELYTDERFLRFPRFAGSIAGRRTWPLPFEACIESIRRIRDVRAVRAATAGRPTAAVVGGSSSYSRFHGIRGGDGERQGSDVDLIVIVPDESATGALVERLSEVDAVDPVDLEIAIARAAAFVRDGLADGRTLFSHKLRVWTRKPDPFAVWRSEEQNTYVMDLRIASTNVLRWLLLDDAPRIEADIAGKWRGIRDFCEFSSYDEDHQRSFSGRNHRFRVDVAEVEHGVLRTSRAYYIDDNDRFYPGTLQNLVLPLIDCRWDDLALRPTLEAFREKVTNRLRHERLAAPHEHLSRTLGHGRAAHFTPAVKRLLDA